MVRIETNLGTWEDNKDIFLESLKADEKFIKALYTDHCYVLVWSKEPITEKTDAELKEAYDKGTECPGVYIEIFKHFDIAHDAISKLNKIDEVGAVVYNVDLKYRKYTTLLKKNDGGTFYLPEPNPRETFWDVYGDWAVDLFCAKVIRFDYHLD